MARTGRFRRFQVSCNHRTPRSKSFSSAGVDGGSMTSTATTTGAGPTTTRTGSPHSNTTALTTDGRTATDHRPAGTRHDSDGEPHDTPAAPADVSSYYLIHRALRDSAARFALAIRGAEPGTDRTRTKALQRWYHGYHAELHMHHTVEDHIFFPALADRVPVMATHADRLDIEHDQIVAAMDRTLAAVDQLAAMPVDDTTHAEAVSAADQLNALLEAHLAYEDADIVPLFVRHFTADEYATLDSGAKKSGSLKTMAFTVPFVAAAGTPEELKMMLDGAPGILRVLLVATRGRYRKLVTAALG
ncbi:hypothetical protein BH10ACT3_BH10ACT3_05260 [soil metagenome]